MILKHENYAPTEALRAEIVIVGTGAGGATAGKVLAEAGHDVLFVEVGKQTTNFARATARAARQAPARNPG